MQVTRIDRLDACWQIAPAWDCMAHGIPFRRTAWLLSWWNHFQSQGDLFVLRVADQQGEVVGIAPWFVDNSLRLGRVLRPLGSGNTCSDYLGILTTAEHEQQVTASLTQWLIDAAAGKFGPENQWDLLDLVSVDAKDLTMVDFVEQLESAGAHAHRSDAMSCWRVSLPATWAEYLATLSRSHRKRVRRFERQWLTSGKASLHTAVSSDELEFGMSNLIELHQQRHTALGQPGCFAESEFTAFLREAAGRLLDEQMLRLHWLELDGQPFAAEFQLIGGDVTFAYLGGMSSEMEGSPGQIIQVAILKKCIEEGQQAFDFLRGDESYKSHWAVQEYKCHDYRVVSNRHAAQLRHQVWLVGGAMKQWIRTGLHIAGMH